MLVLPFNDGASGREANTPQNADKSALGRGRNLEEIAHRSVIEPRIIQQVMGHHEFLPMMYFLKDWVLPEK